MKHVKTLGSLLLGASLLSTQFAAADTSQDKIKVMSRNVYLGADIFPVIEAAQIDPNLVPGAVAEVFQAVQATNYPERAQALADEIARRDPHVIGLQEVSQWFTGPADSLLGGTSPATDIAYDYLDILMAALAERGLDYVVAASVDNADLELPMVTGVDENGYTFLDLRLHDRDVTLVKNSPNISFGNALNGNFSVNGSTAIGNSIVEFTRGYNMIDINVKGADYRFVNTHLEVGSGETATLPYKTLQAAQMGELLGTIAATTSSETPVILLGDFNSSPEDMPFESAIGYGTLYPPYLQAVGSGYADIWLANKKASEGYTCCFDALVSDEDAQLDQRIDHIFLNPGSRNIAKLKSKVVGDSNADMTDVSALYPSDHAGVYGHITLNN